MNELLVEIPLMQHFLKDPNVKTVTRAVDARWNYNGFTKASISGFNPFENAIFLSRESSLDLFFKNRFRNARSFNFKDRLVQELLFLLHDYLHIWCYQWIRELKPSIGFGTNRVTLKNFEDFVFCHILSEAVATVGLDYWYLSTIHLRKTIGIGTLMKTLTSSYHISNDDEFKFFNPDFESQKPQFLRELMEFYCSGVFFGFSKTSLRESPLVLEWLDHEIFYSRVQRNYARSWFRALSSDTIELTEDQLNAPVAIDKKWKWDLIDAVGDLLWRKIKKDEFLFAKKKVHYPYAKKPVNLDARMLNYNITKIDDTKNFDFFFNQVLSRCNYSKFDANLFPLIRLIKEEKNQKVCEAFFAKQESWKPSALEPRWLFFPN